MRIAGFELQRSIVVGLPNGPLAMTSIHSEAIGMDSIVVARS